MKLAKQIITLSSVALVAIGLAFVLISSIVISAQASTLSLRRQARIDYKEEVRSITSIEDEKIQLIEDKPITSSYTPEDKDKELAAAEKSKDNKLRTAKYDYDLALLAAHDAWIVQIEEAFMYPRSAVSTQIFVNGGNVTEVGYNQSLTPMGALMVSGLSFIFVGGTFITVFAVAKKRSQKTGKGETQSETA